MGTYAYNKQRHREEVDHVDSHAFKNALLSLKPRHWSSNIMVESTGAVAFVVGGRTFKTWYKVFGDLQSSKRPLVVLHGGPGLTHDYLLPFRRLNENHGYDSINRGVKPRNFQGNLPNRRRIPVVLYDQIGNGKSSHYRDCPERFWTPSLFSDELKNLLRRLDIYHDYDLLGHGWGGFLAAHFACSRENTGLHRLILSNSPASMQLMEDGLNILLDNFGSEFAAMIRWHEKRGTTGSFEYLDGLKRFANTHICSLKSWPNELQKSFKDCEADSTVLSRMADRRFFRFDGALRGETLIPFLPNVAVPTLVINSDKDAVQDMAIRPLVERIPNSRWIKLKNSTHVPMHEEPDHYFGVIFEFLAYH